MSTEMPIHYVVPYTPKSNHLLTLNLHNDYIGWAGLIYRASAL